MINKITNKIISLLLLVAISFLSTSYASVTDNSSPNAPNNKLKWHHCKSNPQFLCGSITVPLDYKHPELGEIKLPVSMHVATQKNDGYLLFNFGGPWANNVKILPFIIKTRLTPPMINHFNLLVMDPRGVSPNTITCRTKKQAQLKKINQAMKKIFAQGNENDANKLYELAKQKQELCRYNKLYKYASTANTVQDIEKIRKALNIKKLNLYMASYGTRLGLAYLVSYPQHVEHIILDGNMAPYNQLMSLIGPRALGAVTIFKAFFQNCSEAGNKCILNNLMSATKNKNSTSNLIDRFNKLLRRANQNQGIPTSSEYANRRMTSGMIKNLMYTEMQSSNWKNLAKALYEAEKNNNGDPLMKIYMSNTQYNPTENRFSIDDTATRQSVICEDYIIPNFNSKVTWLKFVSNIHLKYSQIGVISTLWLTPMCIHWQVKSTPLLPKPHAIILPVYEKSFPKVLIIGNTKDPMTPFKNAIAVRKYLNKFNIKSKLIQWNGISHTTLITDSPLSACVFRHVDKFLLDKNLPNNIQCNDWRNPFNT